MVVEGESRQVELTGEGDQLLERGVGPAVRKQVHIRTFVFGSGVGRTETKPVPVRQRGKCEVSTLV